MIKEKTLPISTIKPYEQQLYYQSVIANIIDSVLPLTEKELLNHLYNPEGEELKDCPIDKATPFGYAYEPIQKNPELRQKPIKVCIGNPHPSDWEDFAGSIAASQTENVKVYALLATQGEKGYQGESPEQMQKTINLRKNEIAAAAQKQNVTILPLRNREGYMLPDGDLAENWLALKDVIKEKIRAIDFDVFVIPSEKIDHPDHVAMHYAFIHALQELQQEGFYANKRLPELLVTDPELGNDIGSEEWAVRKIAQQFPERYSFSKRRNQENAMYPFVVSNRIICLDNYIYNTMDVLFSHLTQMYEDIDAKIPHWYQRLIPMLKRLRGLQIGRAFGEGFTKWIIPGVTAEEDILVNYLEADMYQLKQIS